MEAVNRLYKEGYFKRFGISNFMSWEVAQCVEICRAKGYIQPTVYQGLYNSLQRSIEPELITCLRHYGMSLYAYNPLAGGFYTGRYGTGTDHVEADPSSRFDKNTGQGKNYRDRYWNTGYFNGLANIRAAADKHNLTLTEVAFRWMSHHSVLKRELGDAIILGTSSVKHMQQNLDDLDKGPLPADVVQAVDEAWESARPFAVKYHH
ncbi:hypothetical protein D9758_011364 [Tetrapyrgos nigripes]|uniref:NADP-dependent oxidoreductase domain-containing protein n=1 Tax=Tetrapyrgos nigripes TaxID=182062 RepID=A0A8H5G8C2_9AGAR|nr:hypothetical protein D9758_011364 [Tetrapyrgos nigripes]